MNIQSEVTPDKSLQTEKAAGNTESASGDLTRNNSSAHQYVPLQRRQERSLQGGQMIYWLPWGMLETELVHAYICIPII